MPSAEDRTRDACLAYVKSVVAARDGSATEDDYWQDKASNKAYRQLVKTALEGRGELRAGYALLTLIGDLTSEVWEKGVADVDATSGRLFASVSHLLTQLATSAWIGVTALENRFGSFPEYMELDAVTILNLKGADPTKPRELLDRFERLLVEKLGFPVRGATSASQSYYDLDEHYFHNKTGGYIPARPMLVLRLGSASEFDASVYFNWSLLAYLPLLLLCQLAYEIRQANTLRILRTNDPLVNAFRVDSASLVALPDVALGLNTTTGASAVWSRRFPLFEQMHGLDYKPETFAALWSEIAHPLVEARGKGIPQKLMSVIERSVAFVAEARHQSHDDVALHSVIATESLLNPFQPSDSIAERFRTFGAALFTTDAAGRIDAYQRLQKLYSFRSKLVHSAGHGAALDSKDTKFAFEMFLVCLREVLAWAVEQTDKGVQCNGETFKAFFLERLFPSSHPPTSVSPATTAVPEDIGL